MEFDSKYIDRRTGTKWLHPCFDETRPMGFDPLCRRICDPSITIEQALAIQKEIQEMMLQVLQKPEQKYLDKVIIKEYWVPGIKGEKDAPDVKVFAIFPKEPKEAKASAVLSPHGGGLCMGTADLEFYKLARWTADYGCVCFSPEYRLAPEHRYPAAINDCEATVNWVIENQDRLGVDPERIIVEGSSTGAHLAAALTHRLKERGGFQFCAQILAFPPLDDRLANDSSNIYFEEVWLPISDQWSMRNYLGSELYCRGDVPPDAIPGHARDFSGLPPAFIHTADNDHGHDDCINYARNLMKAGIFVDLHIWGGAFHAFHSLHPETTLSQRLIEEIYIQVQDALTGKLVRSFK